MSSRPISAKDLWTRGHIDESVIEFRSSETGLLYPPQPLINAILPVKTAYVNRIERNWDTTNASIRLYLDTRVHGQSITRIIPNLRKQKRKMPSAI
jgi:hypothetical protein